MKNWNWSLFWVILLIGLFGILLNKSLNTILEALTVWACFSIPLGLFLAFLTKDRTK